MKFGDLISETGFVRNDFPNISEIPIKIFDGKNKLLTEEVCFNEPILDKNWNSKLNFGRMLEALNENPPKRLEAKITEDILAIYIDNNVLPKFFWRF